MFEAVNPKVDIPKLENDQLAFWRMNRIFERTLEEREGAPNFVFYEGPPTANGMPGSHHVLARAFKDMFPRYKVMRGYYVLRRGGWDTHGLPVEIEVEKELGITHKHEIEAYGIARFNEKCKASVFRYIADWEKLTERIAFWVDLDNAYVTFTNDYIESVWWILQQLWNKELLYKGHKVVPYCPRCGTPLSSHEVSQGYQDTRDPSVFVRFPLRDKPGVYFLAWTTTPWTLPGNVALAVGENIDYVQVEGLAPGGEGKENLILAADLVDTVLINPDQYTVVKRFKGKDLLGQHYDPLYHFLPVEEDYAYIVAGDFVSTEDGTGIVHIAPAFGADDMAMRDKHRLPMLLTVTPDGNFIDEVTNFRGMWFKAADPEITRDLKERSLLYSAGEHEHNYPFCWRCDTPLMYFARETWFIRTTEYKQRLIDLNQTIKWVPEHVRDGRFGNWLEDLKDWALGRERFWGTPLPIWVDDRTGEMICVGGVKELSELVGRDLSDLDLHRPFVDEITFPNPNGGDGTMRRVPELIDVWFDSGAMQAAQWGYPHRNQDMFEQQHPADYICEAVDQTRGWFYSLHAIGGLVFDSVAFKNVINLGHIQDAEGKKMSKSKGNAVDPWEVLGKHGADAFRWYLYTAGPPGESRRFSVDLVGEVVKKFWSTLWNTYSFFVTYANIDEWTPESVAPPVAERDALDRWALAALHQLVERVTAGYEDYDAPGVTRPVQTFVEMLSNWYVRLSRRRFWKSESDAEKLGAYATLYQCLVTVSKLIAPTMPFLSEAIYRNLVAGVIQNAPDSVHLAEWPEHDASLIDETLLKEMSLVQNLVSVGLAARNSARMRVRQPLASVEFAFPEDVDSGAIERFADLITSELNVKRVGTRSVDEASKLLSTVYTLSPSPRLLGKKLGKDFQRVNSALKEGEQDFVQPIAEALLSGENASFEVDGAVFEVTPEEVEIQSSPEVADGYGVADDNGYWAVVETTLTDELIREGLAREIVRRVQTVRRDADFNIDDRIILRYETSSEELTQAIEQFVDYIRHETLCDSLEVGLADDDGFYRQEFTPESRNAINGQSLVVGVKRVEG